MVTKKSTPKTNRTDKATSEAKATEAPKKELISFDEYIQKAKPHRGLIASFKYEALKTEKGLSERSEAEWKADFEAQSKRKYKSFQ